MINGMKYKERLITVEQSKRLLADIDSRTWSNELSRRVQHYGYKYNYRDRKIDESMKVERIPKSIDFLIDILIESDMLRTRPDQLIVNEYNIGQGIGAHIDCVPCFKEDIVSFSLNDTCVMEFKNIHSQEVVKMTLAEDSALLLSGESRYEWTHQIRPRTRGRRVSLTFRNVILSK